MKRYLTSMIAIGFALASFCAIAQFEEPPVDERAETPAFESLDVDGDGYVSRDEARTLPCLAENFDYIESESEEGLNRGEFERAVQSYCTGW